MKAVASGLAGNEHLAAHPKAVFRRVIVGDYFELGHGIDGGLHRLRLKAERPAGGAGTVIHAIEQDVGLEGVLAESNEAALRAVFAGGARAVPLRAGRLDAERELGQLEVVAEVQRHLHDALVFNHLAHGGGFGLEQDSRRRDLHRFRNRADAQREVQAGDLVDVEFQVITRQSREAGFGGFDLVRTGRQKRDGVKPELAGLRGIHNAGGYVGDGDRYVGHVGAGLVGDDALNAGILAERCAGEESQQGRKGKSR